MRTDDLRQIGGCPRENAAGLPLRDFDSCPTVTIILPIRNEGIFIEHSLGSVLAQEYPPALTQILVVDGMSDDDTRERVQWLRALHREHEIVLLDNPGRIVSTALNIGLRHATGVVVIRVDGHCAIPSDYISRCVELLNTTHAHCVGGAINTVGATGVARSIALAQSCLFGAGTSVFRIGASSGRYVDTLAFGAYRRIVFDRLGGFDEELVRNQDDEFNFRLLQHGGQIWLEPSIQTMYFSRSSLRDLWRQYYQYGFYKVRVIQKRRAVISWRQLAPVVFVVCLLATLVLALGSGQVAWALLIGGPYLLANMTASVWAARAEWRCLPSLPLAFLILHSSYGFGFLVGLWHWRHGWNESVKTQAGTREQPEPQPPLSSQECQQP